MLLSVGSIQRKLLRNVQRYCCILRRLHALDHLHEVRRLCRAATQTKQKTHALVSLTFCRPCLSLCGSVRLELSQVRLSTLGSSRCI